MSLDTMTCPDCGEVSTLTESIEWGWCPVCCDFTARLWQGDRLLTREEVHARAEAAVGHRIVRGGLRTTDLLHAFDRATGMCRCGAGPLSTAEWVAHYNAQEVPHVTVQSPIVPPGTAVIGAVGLGAQIYEPAPPWWRRAWDRVLLTVMCGHCLLPRFAPPHVLFCDDRLRRR